MPLTERARIVLRGIGQVMFQGNEFTGILFLIGIAVASPMLAVGAILGAIIGPSTAELAKFDRKAITDGLFGFNSTLVGIALTFYLRPVPLTWILIVLCSVASVFLTHLLRRSTKIPTYTTPFILMTWLALIVAHGIAGTTIDVKPAASLATPDGFVTAILEGVSEVMFGANVLTGILFLAGIAISDWRHAAIALMGSIVGTAIAYYHNDPSGSISVGIYGYNAALAAMALYLWRPALSAPILAAIVSAPITEFFPKSLGLPALTAPFVLASWLILAVVVLETKLGYGSD